VEYINFVQCPTVEHTFSKCWRVAIPSYKHFLEHFCYALFALLLPTIYNLLLTAVKCEMLAGEVFKLSNDCLGTEFSN
jgi:hypothetical protein